MRVNDVVARAFETDEGHATRGDDDVQIGGLVRLHGGDDVGRLGDLWAVRGLGLRRFPHHQGDGKKKGELEAQVERDRGFVPH